MFSGGCRERALRLDATHGCASSNHLIWPSMFPPHYGCLLSCPKRVGWCRGNVHLNQNAVNSPSESLDLGKEIAKSCSFKHARFCGPRPTYERGRTCRWQSFVGFVPFIASFIRFRCQPRNRSNVQTEFSPSRPIGRSRSLRAFGLAAICTATRGALGLSLCGNRILRARADTGYALVRTAPSRRRQG